MEAASFGAVHPGAKPRDSDAPRRLSSSVGGSAEASVVSQDPQAVIRTRPTFTGRHSPPLGVPAKRRKRLPKAAPTSPPWVYKAEYGVAEVPWFFRHGAGLEDALFALRQAWGLKSHVSGIASASLSAFRRRVAKNGRPGLESYAAALRAALGAQMPAGEGGSAFLEKMQVRRDILLLLVPLIFLYAAADTVSPSVLRRKLRVKCSDFPDLPELLHVAGAADADVALFAHDWGVSRESAGRILTLPRRALALELSRFLTSRRGTWFRRGRISADFREGRPTGKPDSVRRTRKSLHDTEESRARMERIADKVHEKTGFKRGSVKRACKAIAESEKSGIKWTAVKRRAYDRRHS